MNAVGDSYNALPMLEEADHSILFRPPARLLDEKPEYQVVHSHEELKSELQNIFTNHGS